MIIIVIIAFNIHFSIVNITDTVVFFATFSAISVFLCFMVNCIGTLLIALLGLLTLRCIYYAKNFNLKKRFNLKAQCV